MPTFAGNVRILTNAFPSFTGGQMLIACTPREAWRFSGETKLQVGKADLYMVPDTQGNREVFYELHQENPEAKLIARID